MRSMLTKSFWYICGRSILENLNWTLLLYVLNWPVLYVAHTIPNIWECHCGSKSSVIICRVPLWVQLMCAMICSFMSKKNLIERFLTVLCTIQPYPSTHLNQRNALIKGLIGALTKLLFMPLLAVFPIPIPIWSDFVTLIRSLCVNVRNQYND